MNEVPKTPRKSAADRLEDWKHGIRKDYEKALIILQRTEGFSESEAQDCLHTAIANMLRQWQEEGPPEHILSWAAYLAHSGSHVLRQKPTKDARLLQFRSPIADEPDSVNFDVPDKPSPPEEPAIRREIVRRVLSEIVKLPFKQACALMLWTLGRSFSEIGSILDVAEARARVLKCKALKILKEKGGEIDFPGCGNPVRLPW